MVIKKRPDDEVVKILKSGGVGVLKTDTLYGIVGSAFDKKTIRRIYKIKQRDSKKPLIILIGLIGDLKKFWVKIDPALIKKLKRFWPGKVSIILPCDSKKFSYLHRGTETLAFRLPAKKNLLNLLRLTGPLVAPSANPENLKPATNIKQAINYFGNKVDFYIDSGRPSASPSTLAVFKDGRLEIKRFGAVKISGLIPDKSSNLK